MLWLLIAGLLVVAVVYLLLPLFKVADEIVDDRKQQNILIVREQMNELEGSFERGEIESEQYRQRRNELELTLLLDVSGSEAESKIKSKASIASWVSAGFLALFIPVAAIAMYLYLGTPNAQQLAVETVRPEIPMTADGKPDIEKMVGSLHAKLRQNPENAEGWYMLGRSYMMMQRFEGAVEAYRNLYRLKPEDPDVMVMLADATSMNQQGKLAGRPIELIERALEMAPNNTTALWLSGIALEQQGKHQAAIDRWTKLKPLLGDKPEEKIQLERLIQRASSSLSGQAASNKASHNNNGDPATESLDQPSSQDEQNVPEVTVLVSLSETFQNQVSPEDSVFIYAKAQTGPPVPLAAQRLQVKDLPVTITLNDKMAMMPTMTLSMFDTLIVGARVSKSGNAIGQNGDLFAEKEQVTHGDSVTLQINDTLKK